MANTTNLNLVKPAGTDYALVSVINGNMDIIDSKVGAVPSNASVQGQIDTLNNQITNDRPLKNKIKLMQSGDNTTFPIPLQTGAANEAFLLFGASGVAAPFCYLVALGASNAVAICKIYDIYGITVTGAVSNNVLTVTFSPSLTGYVKCIGIR